MFSMFEDSNFNHNIKTWNVSNVIEFGKMFKNSTFNQNISNWNIHENANLNSIIKNTPITNINHLPIILKTPQHLFLNFDPHVCLNLLPTKEMLFYIFSMKKMNSFEQNILKNKLSKIQQNTPPK